MPESGTRMPYGNNCTWQMSLDKGMEGGQPLTDLTEQLNWNYQSEPVSSISSFLTFILSCIIHFSHSQLQEFIFSLSVSLPLMLTCTCILRPMFVCKINTKLLPLSVGFLSSSFPLWCTNTLLVHYIVTKLINTSCQHFLFFHQQSAYLTLQQVVCLAQWHL